MFFVFAGFVPTGDGTINAIAFALAVGIAADAFVVRMILVPATLALLGKHAWWLPRWLSWLPTLDVEGAGLERLVPVGYQRKAVDDTWTALEVTVLADIRLTQVSRRVGYSRNKSAAATAHALVQFTTDLIG